MFGLPDFQNEKLFESYAPWVRIDEGRIVEGYLQDLEAFYEANHPQIRDRTGSG